jgi:hypothetical protein
MRLYMKASRKESQNCLGNNTLVHLLEYSCVGCGFTPPVEEQAGGGREAQAVYPSPTDARLAFFAPVHYSIPEPVDGGSSLYFAKRLCYRCYFWMLLLPIFAALGFGAWMTSMFAGDDTGSAGALSSLSMIWIAIGLTVVALAFDAAVELLLLRWVLFGEMMWSKWGCMFIIGLRVLAIVYQCLVLLLGGQLGNEASALMPVYFRLGMVALAAVYLLQQLWIGWVLFRETTERKSY